MDHARIAMSLKHLIREPESQVATAYLSGGGPPTTTVSSFSMLTPDQQHSLDVICDKIARILNGKPDYLDNWDDIAGYARLVADRLRKEQGENK